ncbi:hypothetical protein EL22_02820 [Halostagnicola sp. A56]|uniref:DUF7289 family protein n=1 Tax=Halostagnicola sp. A56 TaxID=1495067 RepID=UPI0004A07F69|nr:hypothetical protein [Halostagnicola sp. A56]KDE58740.1 hypothetical protein EL22_02820 [Halostagnicola sp. A56]
MEPVNATRSERRGRENERAVTELVGFVLLFGTVVLSVALVSVVGVQSIQLHEQQQSTRDVDRALVALSADFDDIVRSEGVRERTNRLAVAGGQISTGEPGPKVDLRIDYREGTETESWRLGSVVYESGSESVAYEGGGVFRSGEMGERTAIVEPRLTCSDETALVSLVRITEDGGSYQSARRASITATETGTAYRETFSDVRSLEVGVETDTADTRGWTDVFGSEWTQTGRGWTCAGSDGDGIERLAVHVVELEVSVVPSA